MNKKRYTFFLALASILYVSTGYAMDTSESEQSSSFFIINIQNPTAARIYEALVQIGSIQNYKRKAVAEHGLPFCKSKLFPDLDEVGKLFTKLNSLKNAHELSHTLNIHSRV